MRLGLFALISSIAITSTIPVLAATRTRHSSHRSVVKHVAAKPKILGQRTIDDDRATQIQAALIQAGYLNGTPSGHWDTDSQAAMQKLQGDNGWQTKLVPDSRALIKLGLGPNPTAATLATPPTVPSGSPANILSGSQH